MPSLSRRIRSSWIGSRSLKARQGIELRGMQWLSDRIPKMSRSKSLRLAEWIGRIAYTIDSRGKQIALENLRVAQANGQLRLPKQDLSQMLRACYANFARNFVDLFWYSRLNAETIHDWLEIEGRERLEQVIQENRGAIFITPHFGCFELSSLVVGYLGCELNIVAQEFRNNALTDVFFQARQSSGHRVHPRQGVMLKLMRLLRDQQHIALLTDLSVIPQSATNAIRCFGTPTSATALHVELASRCGAPILAATCEPLDNGKARLRILDLFEPSSGIASNRNRRAMVVQRIWNCFEQVIEERPELWLWMYRHWRYGIDSAFLQFPKYANHSDVFQQHCEQELDAALNNPIDARGSYRWLKAS